MTGAAVQDLFERVIVAVDPPQLPGGFESERQILLDAAVGDARYVLVRLPAADDHGDRPAVTNLSPREREVARMVAKGLTNKNIARVLDISLWTVSTHLRRIFAKLGVATRAAMVARLLEEDSAVNDQVDAVRDVEVDDAIC
jgi:DNA-binding CsgD family transcriptional regulator